MKHLTRSLNLKQATAINMIDMVGIGPFVTIPLVMASMHGPPSLFAWLLGALLAVCDGFVWAELGAKYPEAGGSYVFLRKLFGEKKWGSLFSFLYLWQTTIQAPLVIASGAIGFSEYFTYLVPLDDLQRKMVSGALIVILYILLYRKISDVGKISVALWAGVIITLLWLIFSGITHFNFQRTFDFSFSDFGSSGLFSVILGQATVKTIYCYLGYYNVCHLGGEIKNPVKNIPRSIFISIAGISVLYLLMQVSILSVISPGSIKDPKHVVSTFFEILYGQPAANVATILILWIALASLFSVILGYSRVPYAAAVDGNYFSIFSKVHPTKNFPHVSLTILCAVAFVFSLLFRLKEVISTIVVIRIFIQFISQAVGVMLLRTKKEKTTLPFRMWLFPVPAVLAILIWLFVFFSSEYIYIWYATAVLASGILLFLAYTKRKGVWPFVYTDKTSSA
ncbi:MAG: amino acid permease [Bacteroidetes bacterium]|nr:amino acid permease [Bacteroidota bacterium]